MKNTTLIFPTFALLWEFKCAAEILTCKVNSEQLSLTAELSEEQIDKAIENYKAKFPEDEMAK